MKNKSYQDIILRYPELFSHPEGCQEPFALFGFECGIGWYNLIRCLCATLYSDYRNAKESLAHYEKALKHSDNYIAQQQTYYKGKNISDDFFRKKLNEDYEAALKSLENAKQQLPKVVQVKEKYGSLRFYVDNGNATVFLLINYAELMSETICEVCGNVAEISNKGWQRALCNSHRK